MSEERLDGKRKRGSLVAQKLDVSKDCYINAAFRSTTDREVFMFIHFDYFVISCDPDSTTNNLIIRGPIILCDGFPSLYGTCFQESGVTAAFGVGGDGAIFFSGSNCATFHIQSETQTGVVMDGPMHITEMFPCLIGVKFLESHVDAALESPVPGSDEAYLFQGSEYALIDSLKPTLIRTGLITDEFPCLANTMFASGIGAAFASHIPNQAFLFKHNFYVLIHFTPGHPNDSYIISGPQEIVPDNWPCLQGLIPFITTGNDIMEPKMWIPVKLRNGYNRIPILPNDKHKYSKPAVPLTPEQCKPPMDYGYVQAAFRSNHKNEVFMFLDMEYVVINYDPASPGMDFVVKGPYLLCDGFPSLYDTSLNEYRIHAAFGCHGVNEAFLFSNNECAKIIYEPDTRTGVMIKEPETFEAMFPCLDGVLDQDNPIDAAFESMVTGEAFLFQGSNYFLINYSKRTLISTGLITDAFPCLRNTIFESNIESAFASHNCNQAYLFKGNSYVLIHFSPVSDGSNDSSIIAGPEDIMPNNWPSLQGLVPFQTNRCREVEPKTWVPIWHDRGCLVVPMIE